MFSDTSLLGINTSQQNAYDAYMRRLAMKEEFMRPDLNRLAADLGVDPPASATQNPSLNPVLLLGEDE